MHKQYCQYRLFERYTTTPIASQYAIYDHFRIFISLASDEQVYQSNCLLRTNEAMLALAYCVRQNQIMELRTLAYQEALTLIDHQADFLMFMKYCVQLKAALNGNNARRRGFGRPMRKLVSKWYGKYTNIELANMFGEHRGLSSWTHKDVMALAHLNPKTTHSPNRAAASVATTSAASVAATSAASQSTASNAAAGATSSTAASATSNEMPQAVLVDREHVLQFNFKRGQDYLKYLSGLDQPLGEGALRMRALQNFKTNEKTQDAVSQIQANGFKWTQTPAHLLERVDIWDVLLPRLTFHELLDKLFTLKDLGFLNPDRRFAKKYVKALNNIICNEENPQICPINVFIIKRLYEKNERYLARTKKLHYAKKMEKRGIEINEALTKQLSVLFEHTLSNGKRAPANYFIAMDLRPVDASSE